MIKLDISNHTQAFLTQMEDLARSANPKWVAIFKHCFMNSLELRQMMVGLLLACQTAYIVHDPYANAFNEGRASGGADADDTSNLGAQV